MIEKTQKSTQNDVLEIIEIQENQETVLEGFFSYRKATVFRKYKKCWLIVLKIPVQSTTLIKIS